MISMPKLWDNKREILCTNAYLAYYYKQFRWFTICIWAYAAFFKWKEVYSSNIHHYSMRGLGLLVCEVVTIRGHGHVLFLHVTHTLSSEDAFLDSLFLQPSRYMFDEEFHPFKSCVLRKLYNPPKLYLMIS